MADPAIRAGLLIVVSGLPGSGKTTLARELSPGLVGAIRR
jgi:tRNA uridine 5-carbamoylmethylation protein Kti12